MVILEVWTEIAQNSAYASIGFMFGLLVGSLLPEGQA